MRSRRPESQSSWLSGRSRCDEEDSEERRGGEVRPSVASTLEPGRSLRRADGYPRRGEEEHRGASKEVNAAAATAEREEGEEEVDKVDKVDEEVDAVDEVGKPASYLMLPRASNDAMTPAPGMQRAAGGRGVMAASMATRARLPPRGLFVVMASSQQRQQQQRLLLQ
ncbi:unnamed protein product, partial [Lampetra fluviatilis]